MSSEEQASSTSATTANTSITVTNRQLNVRPFQASTDRNETAIRWEKWLKDIERQFRYFGIAEPETKKDGLIIYGGTTIADLEDTLVDLPGDDVFTILVSKLNKHFLPKKNKDFARFEFGNMQQQDEESLTTYYTRLKEVAKKCAFTDEDEVIRDHLIKTMNNHMILAESCSKIFKEVNDIVKDGFIVIDGVRN